jgi:hypothetical protein
MPKSLEASGCDAGVVNNVLRIAMPKVGAFNFEQTESHIDIDALAARYDEPEFWNRALIEEPDDPLA